MNDDAKKYYLTSAILLGSAFLGITPLVVKFIAETILGNPPVDTSGRATVNIAIALSMVLSIIVSMICAIIGIVKSRPVKK
ncbi:MAG: hypothetical protein NTX11_03220 [Candidatus Saccharibacteria bacterium]|nr:hypothetical protein [Candidatus Saccharibacteria bacterium]